jgi:transcriptional regulator with XRE-family HTH domain
MPVRESAVERGARRGRQLINHLAVELDNARRAGGLSFREVARRAGVNPETVRRALRGETSASTVDLAARLAAVLGLQLSVGLHPDGDPVRDRAHLALLGRLRARLGEHITWRFEVPIPIVGDRRSGDAVIAGAFGEALVEAETRLDDIQALERKVAAKARDLGIEVVILLVADTHHNREVIAMHPELRLAFPISTRACLAAIGNGRKPARNCLVVL